MRKGVNSFVDGAWKTLLGLGGFLEFMSFVSPQDAASNLHHWWRWLTGYVGLCVLFLGAICLAISRLKFFREWRNTQETNYPTPFAGPGTELMGAMISMGATHQNGIFQLKTGARIQTKRWFQTPVAFRVVAKTNSTNIRVSYAEEEIIFKWEIRADLGVLVIRGGPLGIVKEERIGEIAADEWVTIDLIYRCDSFAIFVDGSNRFEGNADFSQCNRPLSVFTEANATVHVKSVMAGLPKENKTKSLPEGAPPASSTSMCGDRPI